MVSIITYFKENGISYTATSSGGSPYDAFEKDRSFGTSYSSNGRTTYGLNDLSFLRGNTGKFALPKPVYCLHFRINGIRDNVNDEYLAFNSFDCFGTIGAVQNMQKKLCAVNFAMFKQSILPNIIMLLYPSFLPT